MLQRTIARLAAAAIVFAASSLAAQENDWKEAYKDKDRTVLIRVSSVQPTKVGVTAWMKLIFTTPLEVKEFNTQAHQMMEKAEYSKTHKWTRRVLMYDKDGRQLVDHANPPNNAGAELIPDTGEETIAKQVWALLKAAPTSKRKK